MQRSSRILLMMFVLCGALLGGCGQKGDLYLPGPTAQPTDAPQETEQDEEEDDDKEA